MICRSPRMFRRCAAALLLFIPVQLSATAVSADERQGKTQPPATAKSPQPTPDTADPQQPPRKPLTPLPELLQKELAGKTALNPEGTVFLDSAGRRLLLRTEVACPDCILEMALVPEGNREHETILRIRSKAFVIHAGLLALGMQPGKPAAFSPEFTAPSGPVISVTAVWLDDQGRRQERPLQEWIRNNTHRYHAAAMSGPPPGLELPYKALRWDKFNKEILWYGPMSDEDRDDLLSKWDHEPYQKAIRQFHEAGRSKPMQAEFVFAGSSMFRDEETGREYYQAEGGHLICTSNFPDALLDIREQSSAADGAQNYEGWTERIPAEGTPVILVLKAAEAAKPAAAK
jgi:hypothetical protein